MGQPIRMCRKRGAGVQAEIKRALLHGSTPIPDGFELADRRVISERFSIYRNNVHNSLLDSLASIFPVLQELIGKQGFRQLAREYVALYPPETPCLFEYGAHMAKYLTAHALALEQPYLSDVACLEYSLLMACHASDSQPDSDILLMLASDPDALDKARFIFAPAVRLLQLDYAGASIWQAHQQADCRERLSQLNVYRKENLLISRPEYCPKINLLRSDEANLLKRLIEGQSLGFALSLTPVEELESLFQYLIEGGCLIGLRSSEF